MNLAKHRLLPLLIFVSTSAIGLAVRATDETPLVIAKGETTEMTYASAPWNKNSTQVDSAFLFLRDQASGQVAKILLYETEPDSSLFSGTFSIQWKDTEKVIPEIYIPPESMRADDRSVNAFSQLLKSGQVEKRPYLMRTDSERHRKVLDVFDSEEQASRARNLYQQEIQLKAKAQATAEAPPSELLETEDLELAEEVGYRQEMAALAQAARERETERIRREQLERQKIESAQKRLLQLNEQRRQMREEKARLLAEKAYEAYQGGDFIEAERQYREATELDPEFRDYYLFYGITLYRNEKYDDALIAFSIAADESNENLELSFYRGMIHYRLNEMALAAKELGLVRQGNDPSLSPSAAFYEGVVLLSSEDYAAAKVAFEYVLDHSKNPQLDAQAEEYIERISEQQRFKKLSEKKWIFQGQIAAVHDSNILFASDTETSQGSTVGSDEQRGGYRLYADLDIERRLIYKKDSQWSASYATEYYYSLDDVFASADPFTHTIELPYSMRGILAERGYRWTITPGYENVFMDASSSGSRYSILSSLLLGSSITVIMARDFMATYSLDIRQDDSLVAESIGPNDADAMKYSLNAQLSFYLDPAFREAVTGSVGLVFNNAKGSEKLYQRAEYQFTYSSPMAWNMTWSGALAGYSLVYPDHASDRKDSNLGLTLSFDKPIGSSWHWLTTANYTSNGSNVAAYEYSKTTVMLGIKYQ